MGKRAQRKRKNGTGRRSGRPDGHFPGRYFHGGAPGLAPGSRLLPSTQLGAAFSYFDPTATYDPAQVFVTTDQNVARAYAARYLHPSGEPRPGDLYEVRPTGALRVDEDYSRHGEFRGVFLACPAAEILRVVDRAVQHTAKELVELERPYLVWGAPDKPVYDEQGWIIPSEQMRDNGVTREWTTSLLPWLRLSDVDAKGRLTNARRAEDPWRAFLEAVPALDRHHLIEEVRSGPTPARRLRCSTCGAEFVDVLPAAHHQLGDREMKLIAQIHEWPSAPTPPLAMAAAHRDPSRWAWLDDHELTIPAAALSD